MPWTTPLTITGGQTAGVSTAFNSHATDLAIIGGARPNYTPTWTQSSTNPTLSNGTLTGDFRQVDKEVDFFIQLTIGSTTTIGTGTFLFALPVAARRSGWQALGGVIDASAGTTQSIPVVGEVVPGALTQMAMRVWPSTAGNGFQVMNQTQPVTWATGDVITLSGRYEAA